jgi:hypothetical protein
LAQPTAEKINKEQMRGSRSSLKKCFDPVVLDLAAKAFIWVLLRNKPSPDLRKNPSELLLRLWGPQDLTLVKRRFGGIFWDEPDGRCKYIFKVPRHKAVASV